MVKTGVFLERIIESYRIAVHPPWMNRLNSFMPFSYFFLYYQAIEGVFDCHDGMIKGHERSGEGHHLSDPCSVLFFVAVDGTLFAWRFVLSIRAFFESMNCIVQKIRTIFAEVLCFVLFLAVNADHRLYRFDLTINSSTA